MKFYSRTCWDWKETLGFWCSANLLMVEKEQMGENVSHTHSLALSLFYTHTRTFTHIHALLHTHINTHTHTHTWAETSPIFFANPLTHSSILQRQPFFCFSFSKKLLLKGSPAKRKKISLRTENAFLKPNNNSNDNDNNNDNGNNNSGIMEGLFR